MKIIENRIKMVISSVLNTNVTTINEDSNSKNTDGWDSLNQMNIVFSLEEEFGIRFTQDEVFKLDNYKELKTSIISKMEKNH